MIVTEANLQRAIRRMVRDAGGKVYKLHGSPYTVAGAPDLIGAVNGIAFALEVKLPGEHATAKQQHELQGWEAQGWTAAVVTSVAEAKKVLDMRGEV